jgi:hypothetical protein
MQVAMLVLEDLKPFNRVMALGISPEQKDLLHLEILI